MSDINVSDANFPIRIESSLADDLLIESVSGEERMGRLFVFQFELLSGNHELHFDKVVGQKVTAILVLENGERFFHGYITEFRYAGSRNEFARYHATVRPWLWFLTRTADCRIFQEKTVPDIIQEVFRDNGMADFEVKLNKTYRQWEYCVQYRESDFNFVSRLMEQEGIYYYFKHEQGKHTLVMVDEVSSHAPFPDYADVTFNPVAETSATAVSGYLDFWTATQAIMPAKYAVQDFNFKAPDVPLLSVLTTNMNHDYPPSNPEIYDYPGEYTVAADGNDAVEIRLEELQCQQEVFHGGGSCRGLAPGCIFDLQEFPREDQNQGYLVVAVEHMMSNQSFISGVDDNQDPYRCQIEVIKSDKAFRTARETPKPVVQGPQTAIVVGPSGEEIHTDEYGRVKVQFHWDRYGQKDDKSSCWIRVSQLWAGKNWGAMDIPRIDQEVIVSFMEGDPDRPVITGRVYNAMQMPPYKLPENKTQSGIKSRSSKQGGPDNFNELRFEDKKGSEEVYLQAEKDETILVKNNKTENVGNDETVTIGNNRTETVMKNETLTVTNNRTRSVLNNESVTVSKFRTHTVGVNENINVGVAQEIVVGGLQAIEVGAAQTVDVGLAHSLTVGASQSVDVGKSRSLSVAKDSNIDVGKDRNANIGEKESVKVGKDWVVDVGDSVTIKCGSSRIVMKKNGNIQLKGKDITFKASGKMGLKASGTITLKGSSIKEN